MDPELRNHLGALKKALMALAPTGAGGFEGLLAASLSSICKQPFRLASSGSQRGRDGDSALDEGAITFEGKRYDSALPLSEIALKLMQLGADNRGQIDAWVCGATTSISSQNAQFLREAGTKQGIGIVLLDWSEATLPVLAIFLALAGESAKAFLRANVTVDSVAAAGVTAIDKIAGTNEFAAAAGNLKAMLCDPSIGPGLAKVANREYLGSVFSCRRTARQLLGQPLAPRDPHNLAAYPRKKLMTLLKPAFSGAPADSLLVVTGQEGCGKSWVIASSWLASDPASILLVVGADRLAKEDASHNIEEFLIDVLLSQTRELDSEATRIRWRRRFASWRESPSPAQSRIALWVDGLNQAPRFPWARWLDAACLAMYRLGGRLVITTRTAHFANIRDDLVSPNREIAVPEWTDDEVLAILRTKQIPTESVASGVLHSMRNPRILGIALELLDAKTITSIRELSIGKLIFEHLRRCNRSGTTHISPAEFARLLRELGQAVVERLSKGTQDDVRLFDPSLNERLAAVSSSRFFELVDPNAELYQIRDEGLQLALALWLIDELKMEERNHRDASARLAVILEPIATLDMTAAIVASAVEVACSQSTCSIAVPSALIRHFIGLQNVPDEYRDAFSCLARHSPVPFLQAAEDGAMGAAHIAHFEWLTGAILDARHDDVAWQAIASQVSDWLRLYSCSPEQLSASVSAEEKAARQAAWQSRLRLRLEGLTNRERAFLDKELHHVVNRELDSLHRLAFMLVAGRPLVEFAPALFAWSFSSSLVSHVYAPHREFLQLVRFNKLDWRNTRQGLLQQLQERFAGERSIVGNWAKVGVLRATGDSGDAQEAEVLAAELTKDRTKFPSWRLVETYCDTDPCDPASPNPTNLGPTIETFKALDAAKLHASEGRTSDDYFFEMALSGLARFAPGAAIEKIRRLAEDILCRTERPRWLGITSIEPHAAILERKTVEAFVDAAQSSNCGPNAEDSKNRTDWATSQYSLLVALPHLNPDEQLAAVAGLQVRLILLRALELLTPAKVEVVDDWLARCEASSDESLTIRVITAIAYSLPSLSARAKAIVAKLLTAQDRLLRSEAIAVTARTADQTLLGRLVASGWDVRNCKQDEDANEVWYGSRAIIWAAKAGFLKVNAAIDCIALGHYGRAALILGVEAARVIADRIDVAIDKVLAMKHFPKAPVIEQSCKDEIASHPPLFSIHDDEENLDTASIVERFGETLEKYEERQQRVHRSFERFRKGLSEADARLVLEDLGFDGVAAIVSARPDLIGSWSKRLLEADWRGKYLLHLFIIQFATAVAKSDAEKAVMILQDSFRHEGIVRQVYGLARIPAESWAVWSCGTIPQFSSECFRRLTEARTDREIAAEVTTAFLAGHGSLVQEYVDALLAKEEPVYMARAIMVSGFSDKNEHASAVLQRFQDSKGFIGTAVYAARYAYERNCWARHWYAEMTRATITTEFWRFSVLLLVVVDGRIDLWREEHKDAGEVFQRFVPTLQQEIERRVKQWQDKRSKKLFGADAPDGAFL